MEYNKYSDSVRPGRIPGRKRPLRNCPNRRIGIENLPLLCYNGLNLTPGRPARGKARLGAAMEERRAEGRRPPALKTKGAVRKYEAWNRKIDT